MKHLSWFIYGPALGLLALITLSGAGNQDWSFDDEDYIATAERARHDPLHVFSPDKEIRSTNVRGASRPTVHLYFLALYTVFGDQPAPYHVASAVLHWMVAFLLALAVSSLGGSRITAFLSGALFLVNLSHLRVVYWVAGVAYLLAALFGIAAFLAFRHAESRGKFKLSWLPPFLFLAAVCAHEAAVVFAGAIFYLLGKRSWRERLATVWPYIVVITIIFLLSRFVYETPIMAASSSGNGLEAGPSQGNFRIGSHLFSAIPLYLLDMAVGVVRDMRWLPLGASERVALGTMLLAALAASAFRFPAIRLAPIWILLALLPFTPWEGGTLAWRYHYLPALGVSALLAILVSWISCRLAFILRMRPLSAILPWLLFALFLALAYPSINYVQAVQHSYSGLYLRRSGEYERALVQYQHAIHRSAGHPSSYRFQFGSALCMLGLQRTDQAYPVLLDLVRNHPAYGEAANWFLRVRARLRHWPPGLMDDRGRITDRQLFGNQMKTEIDQAIRDGQWEEAEALCVAALSVLPESREFHETLRLVLER